MAKNSSRPLGKKTYIIAFPSSWRLLRDIRKHDTAVVTAQGPTGDTAQVMFSRGK